MGFAYLDHRADLAVRAWGETLDEAFVEAARALVAAMVSLDRVRPIVQKGFSLQDSSVELLLVDWLAALVAEKDLTGLVFSRFDVRVTEEGSAVTLGGTAWGEPLDAVRHEARSEVKGISLLGLRIRTENGTWFAEYVADT